MNKTFDSVWHADLPAAGVTGEILKLFKSYLSDRQQRVVVIPCDERKKNNSSDKTVRMSAQFIGSIILITQVVL